MAPLIDVNVVANTGESKTGAKRVSQKYEMPFLQFFFDWGYGLLRAMTKASPSSPLGTLEPPRGHRLLEHLGASSPNEAR